MTRVRIAVFLSGLLILSAAVLIRAQDSTSQLTPASAQTDEEKQRQQEALEKKATALLEQIVGEVQLLKLPENRIRVQTAAADLLWKGNEERARYVFAAADGVAEMMRSTDGSLQRSAARLRQGGGVDCGTARCSVSLSPLATTRS